MSAHDDMKKTDRHSSSGTVVTYPSATSGNSPLAPLPQDGDVLIARRIATWEHDVVIVPRAEHVAHARHDLAIAAVMKRRSSSVWTSG